MLVGSDIKEHKVIFMTYSLRHSQVGQSREVLGCMSCTRLVSRYHDVIDQCAIIVFESERREENQQSKRQTGAALRISSPFNYKINRSTPCAAGCCGLGGDKNYLNKTGYKILKDHAYPKLT